MAGGTKHGLSLHIATEVPSDAAIGPSCRPARFVTLASAADLEAGLLGLGNKEDGVGPDVKSPGLPKKSQRSYVLRRRVDVITRIDLPPRAEPPRRVTMELSCQPSRTWPDPFFPGMSQVVVRVNRCRMSKSPFAYCAAIFRLSWGVKLSPLKVNRRARESTCNLRRRINCGNSGR